MKTLPSLDLNQTVLRVAVNKVFPFCDFDIASNGKVTLEPSIEFSYLNVLMQKFHFNVQLFDMKGSWGMKVNGTWDGVMGMMNNSRADLGMCQLSPTFERQEVAHFSDYIIVDSLGAWTCAPKPKQYPFIVAIPFTASVWALIFLSICILSILQYQTSKDKLSLAIFKHFAIGVHQPISRISHHPIPRILYCLWLLLSVVLSTSYLGVFYSILTLIEHEDPLDTPEAIVSALAEDRVILLAAENNIYTHLMETATANSSLMFYEMQRHHQRKQLKLISGLPEIIKLVFRWKSRNPFLVFIPKVFLNQINAFLKGYRNYYISHDNFLSTSNSFAFPRNSSLWFPFNSVIKRIIESGIHEYWVWKNQNQAIKKFKANPVEYFRTVYGVHLPELAGPQPEQITTDVRSLFLSDLKAVFFLWLFGFAISLIVFLFEICTFLFKYK